MRPHILIVEDHQSRAEPLHARLEREGFDASQARNSEEALSHLALRRPDSVLLDSELETGSSADICRQLWAAPGSEPLPIVLMVSRGHELETVLGAHPGAISYVTKPFTTADLIATLRGTIRVGEPFMEPETLEYGDVQLDVGARQVSRGARIIPLGPTEFRLLRFLMEHPRRVFSRENVVDVLWGRGSGIDRRTVDVHIRRLRKAMNAGGSCDIIRTVRAAGYAMDAEGAGSS